MLTLRTLLIASFFAVLLINVEGYELCGLTYCKDGEVCETSVDGGTCFRKSSRIECNGLFYCYKPRTCCGFDMCCPENSVCCDIKCCPEDSHCEGGECVSYSSRFRGWYGAFGIFPLLVIIAAIVRCRRRAAVIRVSQRRVITTAPVQSRTDQYGYDQGPIVLGFPQADNANTGQPSDADGPPPAYNEVVKPQA